MTRNTPIPNPMGIIVVVWTLLCVLITFLASLRYEPLLKIVQLGALVWWYGIVALACLKYIFSTSSAVYQVASPDDRSEENTRGRVDHGAAVLVVGLTIAFLVGVTLLVFIPFQGVR